MRKFKELVSHSQIIYPNVSSHVLYLISFLPWKRPAATGVTMHEYIQRNAVRVFPLSVVLEDG
jgi:hypothetical protein